MTGVLASPPARALDVRVAASPLVGLRFHLDSRLAELMQVLHDVREEQSLCLDRTDRLRRLFHRNTQARRELVLSIERQSLIAVRRCLTDGVEIAAELGRLDERIAALRRLEASLLRERGVLMELLARLDALIGDEEEVELIGRASRFSRATRRLHRVAEEQYASLEHALLDGPLQRLSDAVLDAELVARPGTDRETARERLAHCRAATLDAQEEFARLMRACWPLRGGVGLAPAVRRLLDEVAPAQPSGLLVLGAERRLPDTVELTAYRIVEEALDNAVRHSGAARVEVVLRFSESRVLALVKDDGQGFDLAAARARLARGHGFGLISMAARAQLAGGQLDVRSVIGAGTEVRAALPAGTPA
jgi:two-component system sensor histidine kinase DegS